MMPQSQARLINILDDSLEAILPQARSIDDCLLLHPESREELEPLLRLALRLQAAHSLAPSSQFRAASVARLRGQLSNQRQRRMGLPGNAAPRRASWQPRFALLAAALLMAFIIIFSSGIWIVSAQALPGSPFYTIKTTAERVQLAVAPGEASRADLQLDFASRRLEESQTLLVKNPGSRVEQTINDYAKHMDEEYRLLGDNSPLPLPDQVRLAQRLVANLPKHQTILQRLLATASASERASIQNAYGISRKVLERAATLTNQPPGSISPQPTPTPTPTPSPELPTGTPQPSAQATPSPVPSSTRIPGILLTARQATRTALPAHFTRTPYAKTPLPCIKGTPSSSNSLPTCPPAITVPPVPRLTWRPTRTPLPPGVPTPTPRVIFPALATLRATRTGNPTTTPVPSTIP